MRYDAPNRLEVRVPLVPGITATRENLLAIRAFLLSVGVRHTVLLPYNPLGAETAVKLGRPPAALSDSFMAVSEERALAALLGNPENR